MNNKLFLIIFIYTDLYLVFPSHISAVIFLCPNHRLFNNCTQASAASGSLKLI